MALTGYYGKGSTYSVDEVDVYLKMTLGSSGAVPSDLGTSGVSAGVTAVSSAGSGVYNITLAGPYAEFIDFGQSIIQASYSASGACAAFVTAYSGSAGTIQITTRTAAGAAVQPASGDIIRLKFTFQRFQDL
jgi:hypothetical protein